MTDLFPGIFRFEQLISRYFQAKRELSINAKTPIFDPVPVEVQRGTDPGFEPVPVEVQRGTDPGFEPVPGKVQRGTDHGFEPVPGKVQRGTDPGSIRPPLPLTTHAARDKIEACQGVGRREILIGRGGAMNGKIASLKSDNRPRFPQIPSDFCISQRTILIYFIANR